MWACRGRTVGVGLSGLGPRSGPNRDMFATMQEWLSSIGVALLGASFGWVVLFSGVVAPVSFKDMDHGRASRHVRRVMKQGHAVLAGLSFAGGGATALGGAPGAGVIAAIVGAVVLLAQFALAPRDDDRPPPGGKRKLQTARIVAAGLTAMMAPLLLVAIGLAIAGV